ncbi:hypothetical protein [Micromonospora sp. CA-246542]
MAKISEQRQAAAKLPAYKREVARLRKRVAELEAQLAAKTKK